MYEKEVAGEVIYRSGMAAENRAILKGKIGKRNVEILADSQGKSGHWKIGNSLFISETGKRIPDLGVYKDKETGNFGLTAFGCTAGFDVGSSSCIRTPAFSDHIEGTNSKNKIKNGPYFQHYCDDDALFAVEHAAKKRVIKCWYE